MKTQAFKHKEKNYKKRYFYNTFSESFKTTGYDHWSINDLSKRFVDLG